MDTNDENKKRPHLLWALVVIALVILGFFLLRPNNVIIKGKIIADSNGEIKTGYYDFRVKVSSKDVEKIQKTYFVIEHIDIQVDSQGRFEIVQEIPRGIDKSVVADMLICYSSAVKSRPDGITRDTQSIDACINNEPEIFDTDLCSIDFSSTSPNNLLSELIGVRQVLVSGICNGIPQASPSTGQDEDEQTLAFNPLTDTLTISNGNSVVIPSTTGTTVQNISNSFPTSNVTNNLNGITQIDTGNGLMGGPITTTGTIQVNSPTCIGTDKLQWNGTAFICSPDLSAAGVTTVTASGPILSSGGATPNISLAACAIGESYVHDGANWVCQAAPTAITVQNGLTDIGGGIVELGGANPLLHNTDIVSSGFNLNVTGAGRVGIGTNTPEFKLDIGNDGVNGGGIIARGTFGSGAALTTSGPGERLIWDPSTGAFRAGGVSGAAWDLANIGAYSFATGQDNLVSGSNSAGFGTGNTVSGTNSFASGTSVTVAGNFSSAFGLATSAGGSFSSAFGLLSNASGDTSFAAGSNAVASNSSTLALGTNVTASGLNSIGIGTNSTASGQNSTVIGTFNNTTGFNSVGIGFNNQLNSDNGYALGYQNTQAAAVGDAFLFGLNNTANAGNAVMFGLNNVVNGGTSQAIGFQNTANGLFSNAFGRLSNALGDYSSTFGTNLVSQGYAQTVLGTFNVASGTPGALVSTDEGLIFGNGTALGSESNAFSVSWQGRTTLYGTNAVVPVSPASAGSIYFDTNTQNFLCSENAGAYFDCFGASGVTSVTAGLGMVNSGTPAAPILDVQAINGVRIDATNDAVMFGGPVNSGLGPLIEDTQLPQSGFTLAFLGNTGTDLFGIGTNATGTNLNERLDVVGNIENIADTSVNPEFVTTIATQNSPNSIQVVGNKAYITAQASNLLQSFDLYNPSTPTPEYTIGTNSQQINRIVSGGRYIYASGTASGIFQVIDTYNNGVGFNTVKGTLTLTGMQISSMALSGNNVILTLDDANPANNDFVSVIDVSNPSYPREVSRVSLGANTNPSAIDVQGGIAYVAMSAPAFVLRAVDVNVPENPVIYGFYTAVICSGASSVDVYGKYAFVGCLAGQISILDVSNPNVGAPGTVATIAAGGSVTDLEVTGRYVVATLAGIDQVRMWDVGTLGAPALVGFVGSGGVAPNSIEVAGRYAYVTNQNTNTIGIIDLHGIETTSILAHSIEGGQLNIEGETNLFGRVNIAGNASIGSHLDVGGDIAATGQITTLINNSMQPARIGTLPMAGGSNSDMVVNGNFAYITDQTVNGIRVVDITNPATPTAIGLPISTGIGSSPRTIVISGRYLFVGNNNSTISILDVTDPSLPVLVSTFTLTLTNVREIIATDKFLYVTGLTSNTIQIIDISNVRAPRVVTAIPVCVDPVAITLQEKYLTVGCNQAIAGNIQIYDITNPLLPVLVSSISAVAPGAIAVIDLDMQANFLYALTANGLLIYNITNIAIPVQDFASATFFGTPPNVMSSLYVSGRYAYVTIGAGVIGSSVWLIIDITSSTLPRVQTSTFTPTAFNNRALVLNGKYVYTVNNNPANNSLEIFEINGVETSNLIAHSAQVAQLVVQNDTNIVGNLAVAGGANFSENVNINGDTTINGQLNVTGRNPATISTTAVGLFPTTVSTWGRYLFLGSTAGSRIFDISDPTTPVLVSSPGITVTSKSIIVGQYLYTATGLGFMVTSLSNPSAPAILSTTVLSVANRSFDIQGKYAYLMKSNGELDIIDISSTITMPIVTTTLIDPAAVNWIEVQGRYAYISYSGINTIYVVDISNPLTPTIVGSIALGLIPNRMVVRESMLYVTNSTGIYAINVANPTLPVLTGTVTGLPGTPISLEVSGKLLYVSGAGGVGIRTYDLSSPTNPILVGGSSVLTVQPNLEVQGRYIYVGDNTIGGLRIMDIGGSYIQQIEASAVETGELRARGDISGNSGTFANGLSVTNSMNVIGDSNVRGKLTVGINTLGPTTGVFTENSGFSFSAMQVLNPTSTAFAVASVTNLNPANSLLNNVLRLNMATQNLPGNVNPRFVRFFAGVANNDTSGTAVGSISLNGAAGVSFNTAGADFGEYYTIIDDSQVGEIIAVTRDGNKKGVTGDKILGVISDSAGFVGNSVEYTAEGEIPTDKKIVGLLGQMKVKVTGENGIIEQGDFVALSSTPGFGMKATENGMVLGKAMENGACVDAGCSETVMVAVQPTWYVPELEGLLMGESDTEAEGEQVDVSVSSLTMNEVLSYLSANVLEVLSANTLTVNSRLNVSGNLYLGANTTGKAIIGAGQTSIVVTFANIFESVPNVFLTENNFIEGKFRVTNVTTSGFTIELENIQQIDVEFTWLSSGTL